MKRLSNYLILVLPLFVCSFDLSQRRVAFCGFSSDKGFYSSQRREYITHEAKAGDASGIPDVIVGIKKSLGLDVDIGVFIAEEENNCMATVSAGGRKLIIADHAFLSTVNQKVGTKWAAVSILAHEVGHHIAGFNRHPSPLEGELDADYWSGFVLQRLGASENAATRCILTYGTDEDTPSHPNRFDRAKTIRKGWQDAMNNTADYTRCQDCKQN